MALPHSRSPQEQHTALEWSTRWFFQDRGPQALLIHSLSPLKNGRKSLLALLLATAIFAPIPPPPGPLFLLAFFSPWASAFWVFSISQILLEENEDVLI